MNEYVYVYTCVRQPPSFRTYTHILLLLSFFHFNVFKHKLIYVKWKELHYSAQFKWFASGVQFEQLRVQNERNYYESFHDFHFVSKSSVLCVGVCVCPIQDVKNRAKSVLKQKKENKIQIKRNDNLLKCDEANQIVRNLKC